MLIIIEPSASAKYSIILIFGYVYGICKVILKITKLFSEYSLSYHWWFNFKVFKTYCFGGESSKRSFGSRPADIRKEKKRGLVKMGEGAKVWKTCLWFLVKIYLLATNEYKGSRYMSNLHHLLDIFFNLTSIFF